MRIVNNHSSAATVTTIRPFEGLGFAMDNIQAAAQGMTLSPHRQQNGSGSPLPAPEYVLQPSGYALLVSLGREIRGR